MWNLRNIPSHLQQGCGNIQGESWNEQGIQRWNSKTFISFHNDILKIVDDGHDKVVQGVLNSWIGQRPDKGSTTEKYYNPEKRDSLHFSRLMNDQCRTKLYSNSTARYCRLSRQRLTSLD